MGTGKREELCSLPGCWVLGQRNNWFSSREVGTGKNVRFSSRVLGTGKTDDGFSSLDHKAGTGKMRQTPRP